MRAIRIVTLGLAAGVWTASPAAAKGHLPTGATIGGLFARAYH